MKIRVMSGGGDSGSGVIGTSPTKDETLFTKAGTDTGEP